jgi:hypothetical protein
MSAKKGKVSHADYVARVEAILRDAGRPFVVVDDAKKAIFSGCQTGNFDLLIYMVEGDHLLATVLPKSRPDPTVGQQAELRQWARVFGAGFVGAFIHATDEPTAWRLDQEPRQPRPLRSVLSVGWDKADPPAASGGVQPAPTAAKRPPEVVAESDEQRRAASLGYLFPGVQPICSAKLEPMLF